MIFRQTSSIPKEDVVFPRLLYWDSRRSQTWHWRSQVLHGAPKVPSCDLTGSKTYHNRSHHITVPVTRDLSYSEGLPEGPPRAWYSPEINSSKFTPHILSDTAGGFQCLKYILRMQRSRMQMPHQIFPDWFGQNGSHWDRVQRCY